MSWVRTTGPVSTITITITIWSAASVSESELQATERRLSDDVLPNYNTVAVVRGDVNDISLNSIYNDVYVRATSQLVGRCLK